MNKEQLTVIVPAHNESRNIDKFLDSLYAQNIPNDISCDVLVVPNACNDDTQEIATHFINTHRDSRWHGEVISVDEIGKTNALNIGIRRSHTDIVVYADSDCKLDFEAVGKLYQFLYSNEDCKVVGGLAVPDFTGFDRKSLLYQFQMTQFVRKCERGVTLPIGRLIAFKKSTFLLFHLIFTLKILG